MPAVWTGGLVPAGVLAARAASGTLGANPIDAALNALGLEALVFLVGCLACTPLQWLSGWTWPVRIRRVLGLLSLGYATAHFLVYVALDQALNVSLVLEDLGKRPFIAVGFACFVLLIPLGLTSTQGAVRRLGFVRWKRLHRLVYVCASLACFHYYLRVKKDVTQPLLYAAAVVALLSARAVASRRGTRETTAKR